MMAPATMHAAEMMLTAPMMRARSVGGLHDWTAAKIGTMNRPAAMATPMKSMPTRTAVPFSRKVATVSVDPAGALLSVTNAMSSRKRPIRIAATGVGRRMMRPPAMTEASKEPTAIPTVKEAR